MALTHKRIRRKGVVMALCGDKRAQHSHNWWDRVDCPGCWKLRVPTDYERCEGFGCQAKVAGYAEDKKGYCRTHLAENGVSNDDDQQNCA